ncbi:MAG TPA: pyruvate dehydrogenase (acetyl-transferring) E1 component subunit alpha [Chondromyces sp.]|nr:pyruvate dehydrogenase (acetyl-transferring) E1 component subunit alpha [Chondromyces sp.]
MRWLNSEEIVVDMFQRLDETGRLIGEPIHQGLKETLVSMYRWMRLARVFDERALKLQRQGKIGTYAPFSGQEAAQVGSAYALNKQDWVFPSYREIAVQLVHGVPMEQMFSYISGHVKSYKSGHANIFPVQIIISAQTLHAVGSAWASKYTGDGAVSVAYLGDGGTSEGDFHEAMNFASVYKLPIIFFVQNNQWAISVPRSKQTASQSIAQKALAYGMKGIQVDGNDALAVYETMQEALKMAREGNPILIEATTFRQGPHTTADDPTKYRTQEEVEYWKKKDPLARLKAYLTTEGLWNEQLEELELEKAEQAVTEAYKKTASLPRGELKDIFNLVYHEKPQHLRDQEAGVSKGGIVL